MTEQITGAQLLAELALFFIGLAAIIVLLGIAARRTRQPRAPLDNVDDIVGIGRKLAGDESVDSARDRFMGVRRYSPYFGAYVEVVRYVSDREWSFRFVTPPESNIPLDLVDLSRVFGARTPLSRLPRHGPQRVGMKQSDCGMTKPESARIGFYCTRSRWHEGPCALVPREAVAHESRLSRQTP